MVASDADRLRWYGSAKAVDASNAYIAALVAEAPPLTQEQKTRLRVLMRGRAGPSNPQPAPAPTAQAA